MISSEPDPERTTPQRPQVSIPWTPQAKAEYSRLMPSTPDAPTRAALNALIKRAIFQTLQDATPKLPALLNLQNPLFSIDVSIVGDAEIQELNSVHRNKNKPTDVLSFSQMEGEWMPFPPVGIGPKNGVESGEEILLGDLIISIETAVRQAGELKHDLPHEIAFLTAHGVLHLLGYDHDTTSRRRAMFAMQDKIVASLESAPKRAPKRAPKSSAKNAKSSSKKPLISPTVSLG